MAMQVVKQKHGVLTKVIQRFVRRFPEQAHTHLYHRPLALYICTAAAAQQIALLPPSIARQHDDFRLKMIGQAQQQMETLTLPQTHRKRQFPVQFPVCIVGMTLVDDIRYETEGKGTVHAISATMTKTGQPDDRIGDFLHNSTTKIRIFSVTFKQERHFSSIFFCQYHKINVTSRRKTNKVD